MKVTLERADLIRILSSALGYRIEDADVEVCAEPFEVHIQQVNVNELAKQQTAPEPSEEDAPVIETPSSKGDDPESTVLTMTDILKQNEAMGGAAAPRPLGPQETDEPPPITEEEMTAARRYRD